MKDIITLGLKLLLLSLIAAVALGAVNDITKGPIAEQRRLANEKARKEVFVSADAFNEMTLSEKNITDELIVEGYEAMSDGNVVGYVFKTAPKGYGGALEVIVGISAEGELTGVRIGNHNETPGLGAKAKDEPFYSQYNGMKIDSTIGVSKTEQTDTEIKAISGATISSKAVTTGVNHAIDAVKIILEK